MNKGEVMSVHKYVLHFTPSDTWLLHKSMTSLSPHTHPPPLLKVLVFVHARNATVRTATALRDLAADSNELQHFQPDQTPEFGWAAKQVVEAVVLMCWVVCMLQRVGDT